MPSLRALSKAEKSLFITCSLIILPLAAIVFLYGGRDAEPEWNIAPSPPSPNPNGYDFYVAAAKATVRFKPEVDPASDTSGNLPNSPYGLKNYSLARREKWLKANAQTFALFNKGLRTPSIAPDFPINVMGKWSNMRQLARDVSTRTRTFQLKHQPVSATMNALATMQMGQDATRGGGLVHRVVGVSIMSVGRDPLEDWNKTINLLTAPEARFAARRLEALLSHEPTITQTLLADKRDLQIELRRIFNVKGWRSPYTPQALGAVTNEGPSQAIQRQIISKRAINANLNRALDAGIVKANLPYSLGRHATLPSDVDVFTQQLVSWIDRFVMIETRHATNNTMLLLRLALRAYIAKHGEAPSTLAALTPSYLKTIPTDVYNDGKPLFYTPTGKTYRLWSIGPDGINNNGIPLSRTSKDETGRPTLNLFDNTGDFVAGLCR